MSVLESLKPTAHRPAKPINGYWVLLTCLSQSSRTSSSDALCNLFVHTSYPREKPDEAQPKISGGGAEGHSVWPGQAHTSTM
jgi:hypothetical protein